MMLNFLAAVVLVLGSGMAIGNVIFIWPALRDAPLTRMPLHPEVPRFFLVALSLVICAVGSVMAAGAWKHLRRPDAKTVRDVLTSGIYLAICSCLTPLLQHHAYLALAAIIGLLGVRHYLVKRLAPQFGGVH